MRRSGLWYKVRHPWFDPDTAYQAIDYVLHSESAWAYIVFVVPAGHTFAIQVRRCTFLRPACDTPRDETPLWRPLTETERMQDWAEKPVTLNPDLDLDMQ